MGVGGRTIEEAKENLSVKEFGTWISYMQKRGMLAVPEKTERKQNLSEQAKLLLKLNPNTVVK